ncbi:hypothetical protein [Nocardia wallacei]|uniref:hypothetical protein n=1 Tax=Nocardia wallacei TaxID=480035 RepID=UPI0024588BA5|nr:hypothetical protein [Nocardia wallacei]
MRQCTKVGCTRKHKAKGLCQNHYYQQLMTDPQRRAEKNERDRRYARDHPEESRERGRRWRARREQKFSTTEQEGQI